jgi:Holliday junction resolvase RusA-like endonuclease
MKAILFGQLTSGKNAVGITRTGHHYPNKRFADWRADALVQLKALKAIPKQPIDYPMHLTVNYCPGDRRTRDVSGMLDALFHLLMHAKIIEDDGLIRDVTWRWQGISKVCPKVELTISPRPSERGEQ